MKKLILVLALLSLVTASAYAGGSTGPVIIPKGDVTGDPVGPVADLDWNRHHRPVQPVPEPGTMALASMGLIALGAAAKKRRGK